MNKEETEIYNKVWIMVVHKLSSNVKFDTWKYYVEIYNEIKAINPNMKNLLLQIIADLLTASVDVFYKDGEYERICIKLINERKDYLEDEKNKTVFNNDKPKIIVPNLIYNRAH